MRGSSVCGGGAMTVHPSMARPFDVRLLWVTPEAPAVAENDDGGCRKRRHPPRNRHWLSCSRDAQGRASRSSTLDARVRPGGWVGGQVGLGTWASPLSIQLSRVEYQHPPPEGQFREPLDPRRGTPRLPHVTRRPGRRPRRRARRPQPRLRRRPRRRNRILRLWTSASRSPRRCMRCARRRIRFITPSTRSR